MPRTLELEEDMKAAGGIPLGLRCDLPQSADRSGVTVLCHRDPGTLAQLTVWRAYRLLDFSSKKRMAGMSGKQGQMAQHEGWMRWVPGLVTLRHYQPAWLTHDIVAGLVLTTMLVPVGIAYAVA